MNRGEFTVQVKEELAALRPAAPAERRALLAALLRFAATLHIGGTLGPRYTLVLATGSGGVTRLAFWLLQSGYGVRPDFRVREAGALAHQLPDVAARIRKVATSQRSALLRMLTALKVNGAIDAGREVLAGLSRLLVTGIGFHALELELEGDAGPPRERNARAAAQLMLLVAALAPKA